MLSVTAHTTKGVGTAQWLEGARLVIKRSRVRIPAGAAAEFSSPESTFHAVSYFRIHSSPVLLQQHVTDSSHSA